MTRVLCVEDEASFREDIVDFLRMQRFEVDEASNGEEALRQLQHKPYDLVLSDIYMPGLDGFGLLETVSKREDVPPFVFLTALAEAHDQIRGRSLGCDDYLTKPINFDVLLSVVNARLQKTQLMHQRQQQAVAHTKRQLADLAAHELAVPVVEASELLQLWLFKQKHVVDAQTLRYIDAMSIRLNHHMHQLALIHELHTSPSAMLSQVSILAIDQEFMENVAMQLVQRYPLQSVSVMVPESKFIQAEPSHLQRALVLLASPLLHEETSRLVTLFSRTQSDAIEVGVWFDECPLYAPECVVSDLAAYIDGAHEHSLQGRMLAVHFAGALAHSYHASIKMAMIPGTTKCTAIYFAMPRVLSH